MGADEHGCPMRRWAGWRMAVSQIPIRRAAIVVLMLVLSFWTVRANGMLWMRHSIASNLLVQDGKVYFVQLGGGLTVLDEQTGQVLKRVPDVDHGQLMVCGTSLVRAFYDSATIYDSSDMRVLWSKDYSHRVWMGDDRLIYRGHDGEIECRDAHDGKQLWRVADMWGDVMGPTANQLLVASRPAGEDEHSVQLTLLHADDGRVLATIKTDTDVDVMSEFLGPDRVFVVCRPAEYWSTDRNKADRILEYDLTGRLTNTMWLSLDQIDDDSHFDFGGRHFCKDGVVYESGRRPECQRHTGEWSDQVFHLAQGTLTVRPPDGMDSPGSVVTWSPDLGDGWTGWLPYVRWRDSDISTVVEDNGKIFTASSAGEIECVDLATGRSQWVYVFPCQLVPPLDRWGRVSLCDTDGARRYLYTSKRDRRLLGMLRLNDPAATTPSELEAQLASVDRGNLRVIFDPQPMDPYSDLWKRLLLVWTAAVVIAGAGLAVIVLRCKKKLSRFACALMSLFLTAGPVVMLHYWRQVSSDGMLVFKAMIVMLLAAAVYWGIRILLNHRWVMGGLTLLGVATTFFLVYPALCYSHQFLRM